MIDIKRARRRDCGKFVIYTTEGKSLIYPIVGEIEDEDGVWIPISWNKDGVSIEPYARSYDLIEAHPLAGVEPGTPIMVWDRNASAADLRKFKQIIGGEVEVRAIRGSTYSCNNGLTIEQYLKEYLR